MRRNALLRSSWLGTVASLWLGVCGCNETFDDLTGPGGSSSGSTYTGPNLAGAWLVEVETYQVSYDTSQCTAPDLYRLMSANLNVTQTGKDVRGQLQAIRGFLGGTVKGRISEAGGSGIFEHEAGVDLQSEATQEVGGTTLRIDEMNSQEAFASDKLAGLIRIYATRVLPDGTSSTCKLYGNYRAWRP